MTYRVHDEKSFREAFRNIAVEFESAQKSRAWLTRETYSLLADLLDDDSFDLSELCISKPDERGAKPSYNNPFQPGIRILSDSMSKKLTRDFRSKMAMRMYFAYSHFVPQEFVIGFLHEYGNKAAGVRPDNFNIMPEFKEWVASKLVHGKSYGEHRLQSQPTVAHEIDQRCKIIKDSLSDQWTGNDNDDFYD